MKLIQVIIILALTFVSVQKGICQNNTKNKEVAKFYLEEVVNKQRLDMLNKVFADTFLVHILIDSTESQTSIAKQKDFLKYLLKAFPDIHYTISDMIEEGNKIAIRTTLHATHKDEFWGYPAKGNRVNYLSEIFFFRFENGKVVESWVQLDLYNLFRQLKG